MARVLLLARHFPPIGGAGVHRTLGTVRHLPAYGYEPIVVTGPAQLRDRWNPHDAELLDRVPAGTEVHRLGGPEPPPRGGLGTRLDTLRQAPPPWTRWWAEQSFRAGLAAGAEADVILASCIPYETAHVGARLAAELGKPWVADLEDPWALDEMRLYPTRLHRSLELRRMRITLASAAEVIMCAQEAARRVARSMPELAGRVHGIPIGFERDDFRGPAPSGSDEVFRIVHAGSLHTDFGLHLRRSRWRRRLLGGVVAGVDFLTRSHVFLVDAIASDPQLASRVELHLIGELTRGDHAVAEQHAFVRTPGLLSHRETVAAMRSADLLFLPMHDLPPGERAGLIPYKTYEYLAAERPILAAVPDGDVRDMLAPLAHATLVRPPDVNGMREALRSLSAGRPPGGAAPPELERERSVEQIARVLDAAGKRQEARRPQS